jgi:hypothetical protein
MQNTFRPSKAGTGSDLSMLIICFIPARHGAEKQSQIIGISLPAVVKKCPVVTGRDLSLQIFKYNLP